MAWRKEKEGQEEMGRREERGEGEREGTGRGGELGACVLLLLLLIYIAPHTIFDQLLLFFLHLIWHLIKNKTCFGMFSRSSHKKLLAVLTLGERSSARLLG